jgi:tRNA (adenine57-N1/adenine58-N1)-methyltransferase
MELLKGPKKLTLALGDKVNTETGVLDLDKIKKLKIGDEFEFNKQKFKLLKPRFVDVFRSIRRGPQIITLKDAAIIAVMTGMSSGDKVVEAGAGSGALTSVLANQVKPGGKVYSYEYREDFYELAKNNLKNAKLSEFVELKKKDIYQGIDERDVDVVVLDVPEPWRAVDHAKKALVPGGFLVCYIPTTNQLIELANQNWTGFFERFALEVNLRFMNLKPVAVRPATKGLTHTGYLVFARRG